MENWIKQYVEYTKEHEAPLAFHTWSAITAVAAAIKRNVWMDRGFYRIYPGQIMTILVGGAATVRKSTSAKIAMNILEKSGTTKIISGKSSPEAFIDSLVPGMQVMNNGHVAPGDAQAIIFASELASFLSKQSYTEALIPILTDLFDAPNKWVHKTRGHGEVILNNVCVSFLAASTPDWLAEAIPPNAFGGGFMSRIIFVYSDQADKLNALPTREDADIAFEARLIEQLKEIGKTHGPIVLAPRAREWFIKWYKEFMTSEQAQGKEGYWGRRHDHLLRVAMVVALAEGRVLITETDLEVSDALLKEIETNLSQCFKFVGASVTAKDQEIIINTLIRLGGTADMQELTRQLWRKMDHAAMDSALRTLKQAGIVREHTANGLVHVFLDKNLKGKY